LTEVERRHQFQRALYVTAKRLEAEGELGILRAEVVTYVELIGSCRRCGSLEQNEKILPHRGKRFSKAKELCDQPLYRYSLQRLHHRHARGQAQTFGQLADQIQVPTCGLQISTV
jgi:hypothetical protein